MTVQQRRAIVASLLKWLTVAVVCYLTYLAVMVMTGCASTVHPATVESRTIAFEGSEQNAGVLKVWPGKGCLLTAAKKAEYDALLAIYKGGVAGHQFAPPIAKDAGLTQLRGKDEGFPLHEVVWFMDAQRLEVFLLFKSWQRAGRDPI